MLLERPGELIAREDIQKKLWPGDTFVDFDHGLNNAVNRLREALRDSADAPRLIETLSRRGYRFIGHIDGFAEEESAPAVLPAGAAKQETERSQPEATGQSQPRNAPYRWIAIATVLVLVVGLVGLNFYGHEKASSRPIHSIAVLPLENLSGDPSQDYFSDGMTDALITGLANIGSLRVVSRTSTMHYKGSRQPLPEIARELKVDAIVEGSVIRSGTRVRVNAQLVQAPSDRHLWAKVYDRDAREISIGATRYRAEHR